MNVRLSDLWIPIAVVAIAGLLAAGISLLNNRRSVSRSGYRLKSSILSPAERSFLGALEQIDLAGCVLYAKVRLADFIEVTEGGHGSQWQSQFNRISAKHVDFLLTSQTERRPILAIELDDRSHNLGRRKQRDAFVDSVLSSVGLPILHVPARQSYSPEAVLSQINNALRSPQINPPVLR